MNPERTYFMEEQQAVAYSERLADLQVKQVERLSDTLTKQGDTLSDLRVDIAKMMGLVEKLSTLVSRVDNIEARLQVLECNSNKNDGRRAPIYELIKWIAGLVALAIAATVGHIVAK
jgi:uncharacterized coiled-coil protein SlyX